MKYGLIGKPLGHSFSREIHALIADYDYRLFEIDEDELPRFFQERDFSGINVPSAAAISFRTYDVCTAEISPQKSDFSDK